MASQLCDGDTNVCALCIDLGLVSPRSLALLDKFEIYGQMIIRLYTEVCNRNLVTTNLILTACDRQLDGLTRDKLIDAINNRDAGIDVTAIITKMTGPAS